MIELLALFLGLAWAMGGRAHGNLGVRAQEEAFTPTYMWNLSFSSVWAQLQYTSAGSENAWVPSYPSLSQWSEPKLSSAFLYPRMSCSGSLSPNLQFTAAMTRVRIFGFLENAGPADKFEMRIDGRTVATTPSDKPGVLAESPELLWGAHQVMLDLYGGNATMHVENITITTGSKGNPSKKAANDVRTDHPLVKPDGKLNQEQFGFVGKWSVTRVLDNLNRTIAKDRQILNAQAIGGKLSRLNLNIPLNTSFVQITGSVSPRGKYWSAEFDPLPPLTKEGDLSFDGDAPFEIPTLLFSSPLDPTVSYNAALVVGDDPVATQLGVAAVAYWGITEDNGTDASPSPSPSPAPSPGPQRGDGDGGGGGANVGAIVGGVVGGVGGALVLALVGLLFFRLGRRRRRQQGDYAPHPSVDLGDSERFEIDDTATATPYAVPVPLAAGTAPAAGTAGAAHGGPIDAHRDAHRAGRPALPPLVTETKHALDSPSPLTTSSGPTPTRLAPAAGLGTRGARAHAHGHGLPDMVLSPAGRTESESAWTHGTGHTFGAGPGASPGAGPGAGGVPLTPLERETKAAIPSPATAAPETFGALGVGGAIEMRERARRDGPAAPAGPDGGKSRLPLPPALATATAPGPAPAPPPRPRRRVAQELDAGAYPAENEQDEGELELVPPSYNPEWARERPAAHGVHTHTAESPVTPTAAPTTPRYAPL